MHGTQAPHLARAVSAGLEVLNPNMSRRLLPLRGLVAGDHHLQVCNRFVLAA